MYRVIELVTAVVKTYSARLNGKTAVSLSMMNKQKRMLEIIFKTENFAYTVLHKQAQFGHCIKVRNQMENLNSPRWTYIQKRKEF